MRSPVITDAQLAARRIVARRSSQAWRKRRAAWRLELRALRAELKCELSAEEKPVVLQEIARLEEVLNSTIKMV